MINKEQILPTILIIIDVVFSFIYLSEGELRRFFYWMFAAGITASVTF